MALTHAGTYMALVHAGTYMALMHAGTYMFTGVIASAVTEAARRVVCSVIGDVLSC